MKKVLCFGTFDILHPGHTYFLKQAKKYGDFLVVVIARDLTVKKVRDRMARNDEKIRKREVLELKIADQVILGDKNNYYKVLDKVRPDVICLGYDQNIFTDKLKQELKARELDPKVVRIKSFKPEKYKSSKLSTPLLLTKILKSDRVTLLKRGR
ncbi:adenylyltransferase/cytidyltransferase family protein [Candidatus Falkowbacteria bacterium]|nr:adenylyltransferase/cytidyltransferase family protein [Candidatus Falkowbacteria bacterium]